MKLVVSDGRSLTVRDVGEVLYVVEARGPFPVPVWCSSIMSDEEARNLLRELKEKGFTGRSTAPQLKVAAE